MGNCTAAGLEVGDVACFNWGRCLMANEFAEENMVIK